MSSDEFCYSAKILPMRSVLHLACGEKVEGFMTPRKGTIWLSHSNSPWLTAGGGVSVEFTVLSDLSFPTPSEIRFNQRGPLQHATSCCLWKGRSNSHLASATICAWPFNVTNPTYLFSTRGHRKGLNRGTLHLSERHSQKCLLRKSPTSVTSVLRYRDAANNPERLTGVRKTWPLCCGKLWAHQTSERQSFNLLELRSIRNRLPKAMKNNRDQKNKCKNHETSANSKTEWKTSPPKKG